jgi:hypothetical protein
VEVRRDEQLHQVEEVGVDEAGNPVFHGSYQGEPPHDRLFGQLDGPFVQDTWSGRFHVTEDQVVVDGTFEFRYMPGPPATLSGTVTAHTNLDPVDRQSMLSFEKVEL